MTGYIFLAANGYGLIATETDAALQVLALAAGELSEKEYAHWLKQNAPKVRKKAGGLRKKS